MLKLLRESLVVAQELHWVAIGCSIWPFSFKAKWFNEDKRQENRGTQWFISMYISSLGLNGLTNSDLVVNKILSFSAGERYLKISSQVKFIV